MQLKFLYSEALSHLTLSPERTLPPPSPLHAVRIRGSSSSSCTHPLPRTPPPGCSGNPRVQLKFLYSEALSHLIYAAADIFLVPSMFEPCGLTQVRPWD